jgi:hypothetical protein
MVFDNFGHGVPPGGIPLIQRGLATPVDDFYRSRQNNRKNRVRCLKSPTGVFIPVFEVA